MSWQVVADTVLCTLKLPGLQFRDVTYFIERASGTYPRGHMHSFLSFFSTGVLDNGVILLVGSFGL